MTSEKERSLKDVLDHQQANNSSINDSESKPLLAGQQTLDEGGYGSAKKLKTGDYIKFITPKDEYNLVYLSFVLLGAGFLFPW